MKLAVFERDDAGVYDVPKTRRNKHCKSYLKITEFSKIIFQYICSSLFFTSVSCFVLFHVMKSLTRYFKMLCVHARQPCTIFKILYAWHLFAIHSHVLFLCVHSQCTMLLTITYHKYLGLAL